MAKGFVDCAIDRGEYAYYPEDFKLEGEAGRRGGPYTRRRGAGWHTEHDPIENEHAGPEGSVVAYTGHQIRALAMWAERTKNEKYLDMAGKLARGVLRPEFWGNPAEPVHVKGAEHGYADSHFHSRGQALRGVLEYGLVAGDERACSFVREFCDFSRGYGINQIGWIPTHPENIDPEFWRTMEGCFIGDMLAMYIKLTENGFGDYWDDCDRLIRNTMAEAQFTSGELLQRVMDNSPYAPPRNPVAPNSGMESGDVFPNQVSYGDIANRMVGTFGSWVDVTGTYENLVQCCTCNAVRGIFYAWEGITKLKGESAVVNLFLNRASAWLDVDSYLPYEGRVVIRNKTARRVSIRIPSYVNMRELVCRLGSAVIRPEFVGRYLVIDGLAPGDVIELSFPLVKQDYRFTVNGNTPYEKEYSFSMKANTVLDISPRDLRIDTYPYYQREHLKADRAPLHTVTRRIYPIIPRW